MKLREYMDAHNLTLQRFGERVGCSHTTVLRIARGDRGASRRLMLRIVEATAGEVSLEELVKSGLDQPPPRPAPSRAKSATATATATAAAKPKRRRRARPATGEAGG